MISPEPGYVVDDNPQSENVTLFCFKNQGWFRKQNPNIK